MQSIHRRQILKMAGGAWAASGLAQTGPKPVRIGLVGVGNRGFSHVQSLLDVPGVEMPALCDINEANLSRAVAYVEKAGRKKPEGYAGGPEDFRRMVARDDLDAVLTATP